MIIKLKKSLSEQVIKNLKSSHKAFHIKNGNDDLLITSSSLKELPNSLDIYVDDFWVFDNDMQLSSKLFSNKTRVVKIGKATIGGDTKNTVVIGGPCSVESEKQISESASLLSTLGLSVLRGGCYKPRTSPYSFQGLGLEGLQLLSKMRDKYGLSVITEVRDATHVMDVIEHTDVVQVGAKAMYDQGILRACSKTNKPILIKRGFGTTLQEFVQAAEFVLSGGNENVILCERGIRTFETGTRFTLDLCGVAWLQEKCNLPVILDPSHAMGYSYAIPNLSKACVAMGVDGLLIEMHPNPRNAKSDASQQLTHAEFENLLTVLGPVSKSVGYNLI